MELQRKGQPDLGSAHPCFFLAVFCTLPSAAAQQTAKKESDRIRSDTIVGVNGSDRPLSIVLTPPISLSVYCSIVCTPSILAHKQTLGRSSENLEARGEECVDVVPVFT